MSQDRPGLSITRDSHPKLYYFLRHHPEILQVFHNIERDLDLTMGIRLSHSDSDDIVKVYIENLHLPLLLECKAIRKNSEKACGYETLVKGLSFREYDSTFTAKVAADRAAAIAKSAKPKDNIENSLYCYYHGAGDSIAVSAQLLSDIRKLILDYASNPNKETSESRDNEMKFDLVIAARISSGEEQKHESQ